jgi:hypothetical protein
VIWVVASVSERRVAAELGGNGKETELKIEDRMSYIPVSRVDGVDGRKWKT